MSESLPETPASVIRPERLASYRAMEKAYDEFRAKEEELIQQYMVPFNRARAVIWAEYEAKADAAATTPSTERPTTEAGLGK